MPGGTVHIKDDPSCLHASEGAPLYTLHRGFEKQCYRSLVSLVQNIVLFKLQKFNLIAVFQIRDGSWVKNPTATARYLARREQKRQSAKVLL